MGNKEFFIVSRKQSRIKANIVAEYFDAWAKVIISTQKRHPSRSQKIAYIDLFAGPGQYDDGTLSTPIQVIRKATENSDTCERLITIFNDKNLNFINSLENTLLKDSIVSKLKYEPKFYNDEVDDRIAEVFEEMELIPTLCFLDAWGYKGMTPNLLNAVLKDWGCDCIFFFNYNSVNRTLSNSQFINQMDVLFGREHSENLREKLPGLSPDEREDVILKELDLLLNSMKGRYVIRFSFKNHYGNRTNHHLVFVSKNILGYKIMKSIMAKHSSRSDFGVPSYEYNPSEEGVISVFPRMRPFNDLLKMLPIDFAGRTLKMIDIFNEHNVGKRYIEKNYKDALNALEEKGEISANPPMEKRRKLKGKSTFGDNVVVTFPKRET